MVKLVVFNVLLLACCGYALLRGGAPERIVAAIYVLGSGLTVLAAGEAANRFGSVEAGIVVVDLAALIALLILALRAERLWPIWVAAFQVVSTAGHLAKLLDPEMIRWAYAFLISIWSYPMLLLLAIGTYNHEQRLKRFGSDRAWSLLKAAKPDAFTRFMRY